MNKEQKKELFNIINNKGFFGELVEEELFIDFINSFVDLKSMRSTDNRPQIKNAEDDIVKHYIMNDDWGVDYVFETIVGIYHDDEIYYNFLTAVADSKYTIDQTKTEILVSVINGYLHQEGKQFFLYGYGNNNRPVYKIGNIDEEFVPRDIEIIQIPIFIDKNPTGNTRHYDTHKKPDEVPAFVFSYNYFWDDYGANTRFDLFYYDENGDSERIGDVKVLHSKSKTGEEMRNGHYRVIAYMDDRYDGFPSSICSLGQNESYYYSIKRIFGERYMSVLWLLKDCAIFPRIEDKFANHPQFYSLTREREAEDALNNILYKLKDEDIRERFYFSYLFKPTYASQPSPISFRFSSSGPMPNNLYAVIGRNGVGKTQLVSQLPLDLEASDTSKFDHIPTFKKYISVSYCYYDNFTIPDSSATFDYVYCGLLKKKRDGGTEIMTRDDLQSRLISDAITINKKNRVDEWKEVMSTFFEEEILDKWVQINEKGYQTILPQRVATDAKKMSSGQSSFLYVFFNIMANIRKYSLILFDEPETHLHPEAITALINAVHKMLAAYQSYGLIVTHSPIIVRELLSRNVLIMRREGNVQMTRPIGIEPFGENLSVLTSVIFGSEEVAPYYKSRIRQLVREGYTYDAIVEMIQTNGVQLSMNLKMFIKNMERALT